MREFFHCNDESQPVDVTNSSENSHDDAPLDPQFERAVRRVVRRMVRRREADDTVRNRVWQLAESVIRQSSTVRYDQLRLVARVARRIAHKLAEQERNQHYQMMGRRIAVPEACPQLEP